MNEFSDLLLGLPVLLVLGTAAALLVRSRRGRVAAPPADEPTAPTGTAGPAPAAPSTPVVEPDAAPSAPAPSVLEVPAPVGGRMVRLRERLSRSGALGATLLAVLSRDTLTADDWDELEETLLLADVGAGPSAELVDALRERVRVLGVREPAAVRALLREQLVALVDPSMDRTLHTDPVLVTDDDGQPGVHPAVVLVVGVNGTGKTTTVGKLARVLVAQGWTVLLGAADTFRAAAADQLQTWGARVGVATVRSERDGGDPAAVAFDAVRRGRADGVDVVL
ncbi:MAG TPA: signal recognition particle receptor subunit alpha, partial [Actinotalea sp.]|nr:signal recognition particle receptor subunit alpha [Actinotalea sp.]